jgi:hypothetical protein
MVRGATLLEESQSPLDYRVVRWEKTSQVPKYQTRDECVPVLIPFAFDLDCGYERPELILGCI